MNAKRSRHILFAVLLLTGVVSLPLSAQQTNSPDAGFVAPTVPKVPEPTESVPIEKPSPYDVTGIVAQAFKMKKPLRLLSPLAPAKEGDGKDNVSWDPEKPEKPKGIILFGLQW
jgi:hypothetical protein